MGIHVREYGCFSHSHAKVSSYLTLDVTSMAVLWHNMSELVV